MLYVIPDSQANKYLLLVLTLIRKYVRALSKNCIQKTINGSKNKRKQTQMALKILTDVAQINIILYKTERQVCT